MLQLRSLPMSAAARSDTFSVQFPSSTGRSCRPDAGHGRIVGRNQVVGGSAELRMQRCCGRGRRQNDPQIADVGMLMSTLTLIWATVPESAIAITLATPAVRVVRNVDQHGRPPARWQPFAGHVAAADRERDHSAGAEILTHQPRVAAVPLARIGATIQPTARPPLAPNRSLPSPWLAFSSRSRRAIGLKQRTLIVLGRGSLLQFVRARDVAVIDREAAGRQAAVEPHLASGSRPGNTRWACWCGTSSPCCSRRDSPRRRRRCSDRPRCRTIPPGRAGRRRPATGCGRCRCGFPSP